MQKGKTLTQLATEIERQSDTKRDFLATASDVELLPPEAPDAPVRMQLGDNTFGIRKTMHEQLATHTKVPKPYYDRMRHEAPDLLAVNVNRWLGKDDSKRLVRTLDGDGRAFLSDRFRPLDHDQALESVLPVLHKHGVQVTSAEVTERRLYLHVASERLEGEVAKGDPVRMGLLFSNSEVGFGRLLLEGWIERLICLNGMVVGEGFKRSHVGRRMVGGDMEGVEEFFKSDTVRLSDAALFSQVRDIADGLLSEGFFQMTLERMRQATEVKIESDPVKVVEVTRKRLGMNEAEGGSMLRHLIEGGDLSQWGLANAVTRIAHDAEEYDRAVELERLGSRVVELNPKDWKEIQKLAA